MEKLMALWAQLMAPENVVYWAALFGLSEALDMIPQLKASSVWKLVYGALKWMKGKLLPAPKA